MGRTLTPSCKLCRREGVKLLLKGFRCYTAKCAMERQGHNTPPGMHAWRRGRSSDYAVRLREKQKVKRYYGVLEKQFMIYFRMAEHAKGNTATNLLCLLERRLDNVVCKLGFAPAHKSARQMITMGHVYVNGKKLDRPSYLVKVGDKISAKPSEKSSNLFKYYIEIDPNRPVQEWLESDRATLQGLVRAFPTREDVQLPVEEQLIVELCSR